MPAWTGISPSTVTWSGSTAESICWAQLSVDTREDDVDFVLSASSQAPMSACSDRPLSAYSSIISSP